MTPNTPVPTPGRKGVVLLVEDDRDTAQTLMAVLCDEFDVDWASGHEKAVNALGKRSYDVLLADYQLPDGNGLDLIDLALAQHPALSAILLTGHSMDADVKRAQFEGRFLVLFKPFEPAHLLAWVENNAATSQLVRLLRKMAGNQPTGAGP